MTTPDTPQAALRDRIAKAIAEALKPRYGGPQHNTPGGLPLTATAEEVRLHRAQPLADAVLAVLPAPVDRAAVLREAADAITAIIEADRAKFPRRSNDRAALGGAREIVLNLIDKPRRMAAATTADKAAQLGMTPEEYRAARHRTAVDQITAALPGLYATAGLRVEAALAEPAVVQPAQPHNDATQDRVVGYRSPGGHHLYCTLHAYELASYWPAVTAEDLPDGGVCARCGVDVLIPQETSR